MSDIERERELARSNYAAQLEGLGYDSGGNPIVKEEINSPLYIIVATFSGRIRYGLSRKTYLIDVCKTKEESDVRIEKLKESDAIFCISNYECLTEDYGGCLCLGYMPALDKDECKKYKDAIYSVISFNRKPEIISSAEYIE